MLKSVKLFKIIVMNYQNKFPKSIRKFIRKEKTKIKNNFLDTEQRKTAIAKLYEKLLAQTSKKR